MKNIRQKLTAEGRVRPLFISRKQAEKFRHRMQSVTREVKKKFMYSKKYFEKSILNA